MPIALQFPPYLVNTSFKPQFNFYLSCPSQVKMAISYILFPVYLYMGVLGGSAVKNLPAMQESWVQLLGWEDPPEEGMATHSSILVGKIPWTESLLGFSPWSHKRVRHNWTNWGLIYSYLAWRIPWTEEPSGLQSLSLQRVGHNWGGLACACVPTHTHHKH